MADVVRGQSKAVFSLTLEWDRYGNDTSSTF